MIIFLNIKRILCKHMHVCLFSCSVVSTCSPTGSSSMGFPRQEYWSPLPFPSPGNLPNPGIKSTFPVSPALAGRFFTTEPPGKSCKYMHTLKWIWLHFSGHLSIMKNDPEKWSSVFHGCYPMEFSEGFVSEGPLLPTWNIILDRQNGVGGSEGISKENHRSINPFFQKYWPSI